MLIINFKFKYIFSSYWVDEISFEMGLKGTFHTSWPIIFGVHFVLNVTAVVHTCTEVANNFSTEQSFYYASHLPMYYCSTIGTRLTSFGLAFRFGKSWNVQFVTLLIDWIFFASYLSIFLYSYTSRLKSTLTNMARETNYMEVCSHRLKAKAKINFQWYHSNSNSKKNSRPVWIDWNIHFPD